MKPATYRVHIQSRVVDGEEESVEGVLHLFSLLASILRCRLHAADLLLELKILR